MATTRAYLKDLLFTFRKHQELAENAFSQLDDADFFRKPGEHSNSVAIIIKHVAGNLASRWTDFLTSDGEKTWRNRDDEFVIGPNDTRPNLLAAWQKSWSIVGESLATLLANDLFRTVYIRGEPHTVMQAIHRSLAHTIYHVGQIVYLSRMLKTEEWNWLTIPPGQSRQFGNKYLE